MATVSLQKAQAELGDLLRRAEAGEEIVIERENLPSLQLAVVASGDEPSVSRSPAKATEKPVRGYGSFAHLRGQIPEESFLEALPEEELKLWEGGD